MRHRFEKRIYGYTKMFWDIPNEAVVIPREAVVKCTFFNNKRIAAKGLPEGTLQCLLSNGKCVNFVVGRGKVCNQALQILNEQGIPWNLEETRYT